VTFPWFDWLRLVACFPALGSGCTISLAFSAFTGCVSSRAWQRRPDIASSSDWFLALYTLLAEVFFVLPLLLRGLFTAVFTVVVFFHRGERKQQR